MSVEGIMGAIGKKEELGFDHFLLVFDTPLKPIFKVIRR